MHILVTGGTGFIGYHTARKLLAAGHRVRLLVRDKDKLRRLYGSDITDYVLGDVTDAASVNKALEGCDGVVHSAALVSIDRQDADAAVAARAAVAHDLLVPCSDREDREPFEGREERIRTIFFFQRKAEGAHLRIKSAALPRRSTTCRSVTFSAG